MNILLVNGLGTQGFNFWRQNMPLLLESIYQKNHSKLHGGKTSLEINLNLSLAYDEHLKYVENTDFPTTAKFTN
jgi:hypothetical protein